jgi:hypothetical protein
MSRSVFDPRRPAPRARAARSPAVAATLVAFGVAISLVLVAAAATRIRRVGGGRAPLGALAVVRGPARVTAPVALLYIDRSCSHCRPAVIRFDSLARVAGVPAFIVSNDRRDSAAALERYAAQAGVRASGLALDTAHALARAARLSAVPVLVVVDAFGAATITYGAPVRLTHTGASP